MGKRLLLVFMVILLLNSNVCAFSVREFLVDINDFFSGNVVGREVINGDRCEAKYLEGYECSADRTKLLKGYQNTDCSVSYIRYKDCGFGCSGGKCKENVGEQTVSPNVVEGGLGGVPAVEKIVICVPGDTRQCGVSNVGACEYGVQMCDEYGEWGSCTGAINPVTEICNDNVDNDCDGGVDCSDSDCDNDPYCASGYLSVATLEQDYLVGEQINLTDPPVEEKKGFFGKLIDGVKNLFKKEVKGAKIIKEKQIIKDLVRYSKNDYNYVYDNKTGRTYIESYNRTLKSNYYGYIIQFEEPSLIEKQTELKNKNLGKQQIDDQLQVYNQELINKHEQYKSQLRNRINDFDNKLIGEYHKVFNGIALRINEQELSNIRNLDFIEKVSYNYEVKSFLNESVPLINADDVWNLGYTGEGINIAVIDTGIDYTHEDLDEGKVIEEHCYCSAYEGYRDSCCPNGEDEQHGSGAGMDDMGHGTHCAGIAASDGDASGGVLKGVAPDADLIAIKVLDENGAGFDSDIIAGIEISVDPNEDGNFDDHYDIISMSLGYLGGSPDDPSPLAIDNAVDVGVTAAVAAGNSGPLYSTVGCPSCARKAISVGASDKQDNIASFSSRGPTSILGIKPDLTAPGVSICSSQWDDSFCIGYILENGTIISCGNRCVDDVHIPISGTSMATPHVAGAAALLKEAHPDWNPEFIKASLKENSLSTISSFFFAITVPTYQWMVQDLIVTDEVCTKLDHDSFNILSGCEISNGNVDIWILNETVQNIGNFILRSFNSLNPNSPGEIVYEGSWVNTETYYDTGNSIYTRLNHKFENIPKQCYWICSKVDNNHISIEMGEGIHPFYLTKLYTELTSSWEDVNYGGWFGPRFYLESDYKDLPFTQGAGRIDILKSVNTSFIALPDSLELSINNPLQFEIITNLTIYSVGNEDDTFTGDIIMSEDNFNDINCNVTNNILNVGYNNLELECYDIIEGLFTGFLELQSNSIFTKNLDLQSKKSLMTHINLRIPLRLYVDYSPPEIDNVMIEDWVFYGSLVDKYIIWYSDDYLDSAEVYYRETGTTQFNKIEGTIHFNDYYNGILEYGVNIYSLPSGEYEYYIKTKNIAGLITIDDNNGEYYKFYKYEVEPVNQEDYIEVAILPSSSGEPLITDLDVDNINEITYSSSENNFYLTAYENIGDNLYEPETVTNEFAEILDVGYADNDNLLDILAVTSDNTITLYEITNQNPYTVQPIWNDVEVIIGDGKITDLDNDGSKEIIYLDNMEKNLRIWENRGDNNFVNIENISFNDYTGDMAVGDFDDDGLKEIVFGGIYGSIVIVENEGNDLYNIVWSKQIPIFYNAYETLDLGDIDRDGKNEFMVGSGFVGYYFVPARFMVFESDGDNSYKAVWSTRIPEVMFAPGGSGIYDLNNDDKNEFGISAGEIYVLEDIGTNSFKPIWYYEYSGIFLNVGDSDQDTKPEIMFVKENGGLAIFEYIYPKLPKSLINNTGTNNIQGYLLMKVQKLVEGFWQDYEIVVNDSETGTLRNIEGNSYLALDLIWNPYNIVINEEGNFRVYVSLLDGNGNVINVIGGALEDSYEFSVYGDGFDPRYE
ncbi:MAG: S8 family serine peptidase [Nanoarchaeota archaeon]|nr:S8 family serine peptidase [Nanoarchaeota archaeon]